MAAILKNGYNFWTIKARCMQLALVESFHDFEQLLFQAFFFYLSFFFYLYKKYGQGQFYICSVRLWRPSWKMAITFEPLTLDACNWCCWKTYILLNNFYSRHFSPICSKNRARDHFTFITCAYGGHFEKWPPCPQKFQSEMGQYPIKDVFMSVHNILVYLCAKFGAFITKCTIGLISCSTIIVNSKRAF